MSTRKEDTTAEQVEIPSAIHFPLTQLNLGHLSLHLAATPGIRQGRRDRLIVPADPCSEGADGRHGTARGCLEPRIECGALLRVHHGAEGFHCRKGSAKCRRPREQAGADGPFLVRERVYRSQEEPGGLTWGERLRWRWWCWCLRRRCSAPASTRVLAPGSHGALDQAQGAGAAARLQFLVEEVRIAATLAPTQPELGLVRCARAEAGAP
jgi:hypothetical protein